MSQITLSHVTMGYHGEPLFTDVTVAVRPGRKIGIIGQNGTGKSTLLKLMMGELAPTDGEVFRRRDTVLAYQRQEPSFGEGETVLDAMRSIFSSDLDRERTLRDLERRMAEEQDAEQRERLLAEYARHQDEHEAGDAYGIDQRIEVVLGGLGLPREAWDQSIDVFSGGERNIIALAQTLLAAPDVMLLDEPSNHLDLEGLEWFIRFVRQTRATVVMVSHNRHLLDAVTDEIWDLAGRKVTTYTGNYTDYQEQKAEAFALQERQAKNQERLIRRLEFQARRLRDMARAYDDPGQAKRAKAMLRRIEQMDIVERPRDHERHLHASLKGGSRHGALALDLKDFSFAYGDRVLFDGASLEVQFGDRVALVGPNGSGKTTLFNHILEHGNWENPDVRLGKVVRVGDYRQFHDDALDQSMKLLDWLMEETTLLRGAAADLLHRFLFTREDLDRVIATLSGGEKSRLQLARLVAQKVNFLLLDEPTNHLDIQACEQLEGMLEEFKGTLLVISHDRYFLDRLVDVVVEVKDLGLVRYGGDFASWWESRSEAAKQDSARLELRSRQQAAVTTEKSESTAQREREERKARQRDERKVRRRFEEVEAEIARLEEKKVALARDLERAYAPDGDPSRGAALNVELAQVVPTLESLYAEWEELGERLERA